MRLFELTGSSVLRQSPEARKFAELTADSHRNSDNRHFPTNRNRLKQFLAFLEERGYTPLSNGGFGAVFTHPKLDYVIKVFKNDPAYTQFVKVCLEHKNKHFPDFRGKIIAVDPNTSVVRIERLQPLTEADATAVSCLNQFCHSDLSVEEFQNQRPVSFGFHARHVAFQQLIADQPGLLPALDLLRRLKPRAYSFDLHYGNFMRRGQTWVITDPYYS